MDTHDNVTSTLKSLQSEIEDLENRVGEIMMKQLHLKQELNLIQEDSEKVNVIEEGKTELQFPDDYQFTEELRRIMDTLIESQKAWLDDVQATKMKSTGLKGVQIFKEMSQQLSNRLEYLEIARVLIEGPLLPPPPPPQEEEKPTEEEPKVEKKVAKNKKEKRKKSKKK